MDLILAYVWIAAVVVIVAAILVGAWFEPSRVPPADIDWDAGE